MVLISAPAGLKLIRGFNDDALRGEWKGHRSSRLSGQYRVIYKLKKADFLVMVVDLTAHDYRRK
jgi:addiction module RelE/StbE family toxin